MDASPEQIREAIAAVGPRPADIDMHLKGSRSSSNSDGATTPSVERDGANA